MRALKIVGIKKGVDVDEYYDKLFDKALIVLKKRKHNLNMVILI